MLALKKGIHISILYQMFITIYEVEYFSRIEHGEARLAALPRSEVNLLAKT